MKNLLIHYLKKRLHIISIITLIMLLYFAGAYLGETFINEYHYSGEKVPYNSPIPTLTLFVGIISTIVPIFEFQFKMRKISIDQLYSLPIKREKLYLTKYIIGLIEIIIPFIITWLFMLLVMIFKPNLFNFTYYFWYLPAMIVGIIFLYTTICFIFTRNNTIIDGIICLALWIFILPLMYEFFFGVQDNFDASYMFIYTPITRIYVIFDYGFRGTHLSSLESSIISFTLFGIIGIISFILFIILNKKDKSENSMQLSESWFSYKLLIPLYILFSLGLLGDFSLIDILLLIGFYILYAIYRRSFKIGKKYLIIYVIMVLLSTILI